MSLFLMLQKRSSQALYEAPHIIFIALLGGANMRFEWLKWPKANKAYDTWLRNKEK